MSFSLMSWGVERCWKAFHPFQIFFPFPYLSPQKRLCESWTDLFLFSVKAYDAQLHQRLTGVDNTKLKSNLCKINWAMPPEAALPG
jgi:hypothetical protein